MRMTWLQKRRLCKGKLCLIKAVRLLVDSLAESPPAG